MPVWEYSAHAGFFVYSIFYLILFFSSKLSPSYIQLNYVPSASLPLPKLALQATLKLIISTFIDKT